MYNAFLYTGDSDVTTSDSLVSLSEDSPEEIKSTHRTKMPKVKLNVHVQIRKEVSSKLFFNDVGFLLVEFNLKNELYLQTLFRIHIINGAD